ncbi:hypothetical protein GJT88_02010 [Enterobacteriaceae endosymbiont of Donacia tomentosa]|uniref:hypothetical protein n=1 Tax=Enterobacteriaceae endosymbiont of Donacia tomentosa TaxID=2675787 RepID=UPI0014498F18|nr:hypothetical protein [Enterobacteriaceae endosymbiont of Donacia tomentosa]QJC31811.1 hypothetical protein GJT88_02010 [Enterobacteriaceae endosymbiont of Donacia tomentosa]
MNMKKYILFFSMLCIITTSNICAAFPKYNYIDDYYAIIDGNLTKFLNKKHNKKPVVIEIFSFLCPYCYSFYNDVYNKSKYLKTHIPKNARIIRYHAEDVGNNAELSTLAEYNWSIAKLLDVEDKIIGPFYEGIQKNKTIYDYDTMKAAFLKATGITSKMYDGLWNSYFTKATYTRQLDFVDNVDAQSVPNVIVNNKYVINISGLLVEHQKDFPKNYGQLVIKLLQKK